MIKNCTLADRECKGNCAHCGWNPSEVKRRKALFEKNGIKLCKDGLMRLIIKREVS